MSKFKVGDEVTVLISGNVTTVTEVSTRTDHRGNVTTIYLLEGRARDVYYIDEDLAKVVKEQKPRVTNVARSAPANSTITNDTSPATPDMVTMAVLHQYLIDDEPSYTPHHRSHDDNSTYHHTTSHDTYHHSSSNDGGSYDSGSSSSDSSSSSSSD